MYQGTLKRTCPTMEIKHEPAVSGVKIKIEVIYVY